VEGEAAITTGMHLLLERLVQLHIKDRGGDTKTWGGKKKETKGGKKLKRPGGKKNA